MSRTPRIAIVGPSLSILGGQGVQLAELERRLRADGWFVDVVPINPEFPSILGGFRRIPYIRTLINEILYLRSLPAIRHADVIHVFSASYASFLLGPVPAMWIGRRLRKRTILNYHSGEAEDHLSRWGNLVHPWLRLADEIVVPSRFLGDVFARFGYATRVVPNVVDTSRFRFRTRGSMEPHLLSTRNLDDYYRVDLTIDAFARVRAHHPDATLTIAGVGPREDQLRRLAAPLGAAIRFLGRVEPASLPKVHDEANLFVNSSILDNQPVSLLEAFASGLPVVTTAPGDVPAMTRNGELATIVPFQDPQATADAIRELIANGEKTRAMAAAAHESLHRYEWSSVKDLWRKAYLADEDGDARITRISP